MAIICKRCGEKMEINQRCCLKCGALNPENPNNYNLLGIENNETLTLDDNKSNKKIGVNKVSFIIVNSVVFILLAIFMLLLQLLIGRSFLESLFLSLFSIMPSYFQFISLQKLCIKANLPWWGLFIPVYNIYLFFVLAFGNEKKVAKVFVISIVASFLINFLCNIIYMALGNDSKFLINIVSYVILALVLSVIILTFLNLGRRFNMPRILVLLFPFITIPIMAFDKKYQLRRDDEV